MLTTVHDRVAALKIKKANRVEEIVATKRRPPAYDSKLGYLVHHR